MNVLALVAIGFAPGVFWLWLIYQRDRYLPAPPSLVVRTFLWGIAIAVPIALLETALSFGDEGLQEPATHLSAAYVAFVVAGGTEEVGKYLAVRFTVFKSPYFLDPLDGLVFASAGALGFASIENVGYMMSFGPEVILVRGPFSTLAHVVFAGIWGYALGRERRRGRGRSMTLVALLGGVALHGLFDYFLFTGQPLVALGLFAVGVVAFFRLLRSAVRESGRTRRIVAVTAPCPQCEVSQEVAQRECRSCGRSLSSRRQRKRAACGGCAQPVRRYYRFCVTCGGRIDWKARRRERVGVPARRPRAGT